MPRHIGIHLSIAGGMYRALERAEELGINALQVFLKNSSRWQGKPLTDGDIEKFRSARSRLPGIRIFAHTSYLINLAGEGEKLGKSITSLADELDRAQRLGINSIVLHPGSHGGRGEAPGIKQAGSSLRRVYEMTGSPVSILLETTAGQGTGLGHSFQQIRDIIDASGMQDRLKVCLDTCHIFAAGYDISTPAGVDRTIAEFRRVLGLENLALIHLNDSKRECGSRVDRHEHIGKGKISLNGFRKLLRSRSLRHIPLVLETPKFDNDAADRMNLQTVRELIS